MRQYHTSPEKISVKKTSVGDFFRSKNSKVSSWTAKWKNIVAFYVFGTAILMISSVLINIRYLRNVMI